MLYTGFEEDKRLIQVVPSARQIAYENLNEKLNSSCGLSQ